MKPDKRILIEHVTDESAAGRRNAVLFAADGILRRKRRARTLRPAVVLMAAAVVIGASLRTSFHRTVPMMATPTPTSIPATGVHYLTDDELLALFPKTPVGLAKAGDKKRLIFPNVEDEKRYMAPM